MDRGGVTSRSHIYSRQQGKEYPDPCTHFSYLNEFEHISCFFNFVLFYQAIALSSRQAFQRSHWLLLINNHSDSIEESYGNQNGGTGQAWKYISYK
jgi:hypothetical protein